MTATTCTIPPVARPPSPHLGDFSQIFSKFLQAAAGTEPKIEFKELKLNLENEPSAKIKNQLTNSCVSSGELLAPKVPNPRRPKPSPRMAKACQDLLTGKIKEFVPTPPREPVANVTLGSALTDQFVLSMDSTPSVVICSPDQFSDATTKRTSTASTTSNSGGSPQSSISTTTPSPSPDSDKTPKPSQVTNLGTESPRADVFMRPREDPSEKMKYLYHAAATHMAREAGDANYKPHPVYGPESPLAKTFLAGTAYHSVTLTTGAPSATVHNSSLLANHTANHTASHTGHCHANRHANDTANCMGKNTYNYIDNVTKTPTSPFYYYPSQFQPFNGITLFAVEGHKNHDLMKPLYMTTKEEKTRLMSYKLAPTIKGDREMERNLPTMTNKVHVFVDLSNITIGFYDCLKMKRGFPVSMRMKAPRFSFEHLAFALERGRDVEKRVVAGSLVSTYNRKWPDYMQEAKDLGYEMNILQRVPKAAQSPKKGTKRQSNGEVGWTTSGQDSSGEEGYTGQLKHGEQGVDELLHLKMLQSLTDYKPGTLVVATGDAAEAEYSDGFLKNCERLLERGWNVEIIGWSKGISSAWRDPEFKSVWGDRIRLIELDVIVEEIFGAWFGAPGY